MSLAAHKRWTVAFDTPAMRAIVGHCPAAPSPQRGWRRHRFIQNHAHRLEWHGGLAPAACGVLQSGQTVGAKPLTPKVDRYARYANTRGDLVLRNPRRAEDHNLRPLPVADGNRRRVDPAFQLAALLATQYNLATRHCSPQRSVRSMSKGTMHCQAISETLH